MVVTTLFGFLFITAWFNRAVNCHHTADQIKIGMSDRLVNHGSFQNPACHGKEEDVIEIPVITASYLVGYVNTNVTELLQVLQASFDLKIL